jgi:hypothetical protein
MMSMQEDIADVLRAAQADQMEASLVVMGKALGLYLRQLLDSGFSRDEAITLVQDYHSIMIGAATMYRAQRIDE